MVSLLSIILVALLVMMALNSAVVPVGNVKGMIKVDGLAEGKIAQKGCICTHSTASCDMTINLILANIEVKKNYD